MRPVCIMVGMLIASMVLAEEETKKPPGLATTGKQFDVEVIVKSVILDYVALRPKSGTGDPAVSNDKFLVIRLEIRNNSQKDATYRTVNGAPGQPGYAALVDGRRQACTLAAFGDLERTGITHQATIKPGESVEDVVAFLPCKDCQGKLTLFLPSNCFGGNGKAAMQFDMPKEEATPASDKPRYATPDQDAK